MHLLINSLSGLGIFSQRASTEEQECQCGTKIPGSLSQLFISNKVVGGNAAPKEFIPWQVAITSRLVEEAFCGGTIIGPKTILSAAHCFDGNLLPHYYVVSVGITDTDNLEEKLKGLVPIIMIKCYFFYHSFFYFVCEAPKLKNPFLCFL